jgi:transglutaminase-like putative cysteine protease
MTSHGTSAAPTRTRTLAVTHETAYRYEQPVTASDHVFRLRPVHDGAQAVLSFQLDVQPPGVTSPFEDLFGNLAHHHEPDAPFVEMRVVSRSTVRLWTHPTLDPPNVKASVLPLVWAPSEQRVLQPFLNAPELPRPELRAIADYGDDVADRNDYDLVGTLTDLAATIHHEFEYTPGVTTLQTTPFEVLSSQRGVCQDFANLFIAVVRLLRVPARYRVGYVFTGGDYTNREQGDASHAWVECYLPWLGWRGFDPTNGRAVDLDHVRVACGRDYRDATPTSGTIYEGGGSETLHASVEVQELTGSQTAS